jgi:hypothetical protein
MTWINLLIFCDYDSFSIAIQPRCIIDHEVCMWRCTTWPWPHYFVKFTSSFFVIMTVSSLPYNLHFCMFIIFGPYIYDRRYISLFIHMYIYMYPYIYMYKVCDLNTISVSWYFDFCSHYYYMLVCQYSTVV